MRCDQPHVQVHRPAMVLGMPRTLEEARCRTAAYAFENSAAVSALLETQDFRAERLQP